VSRTGAAPTSARADQAARAARPVRIAGALLAAVLAAAASHAAPPHQHGVAHLQMRYDGAGLVIELDSPLDNLLGFERPPATDAERASAEAAAKTLDDAEAMFRVDPSAACKLERADVRVPALGLGPPGTPPAEPGEHSDVVAIYSYRCGGAAPAWVKLPMRQVFPRIQRIELAVSTPRGQLQATLRGQADQARLAR